MNLKIIKQSYIFLILSLYLIKKKWITFLLDSLEIFIPMNYLFLIDSNDFKNIQKIFEKCNLKVKKIISKNFIEGATLINKNNFDTFLKARDRRGYIKNSFFLRTL